MLLDLIRTGPVSGASVLDVGGGIGVIDQELLREGARHAVLVEASPAYLAVAREEASRASVGDRIELVAGDFVRIADGIDAADVVTLDRVVCCYPDVQNLVRLTAERALRLYALVRPRDRWWLRLGARLLNLVYLLRRQQYRTFAHPNSLVDRTVGDAGLRLVAERTTLVWRVALYARPAPG